MFNDSIKLIVPTFFIALGTATAQTAMASEPKVYETFDMEYWKTSALILSENEDVTIEGTPTVALTAFGRSVEFNGVDERILVDRNPIFGAEEFTIEAVVFPYSAYEVSPAPRFLQAQTGASRWKCD